jgi:hypothetical protein
MGIVELLVQVLKLIRNIAKRVALESKARLLRKKKDEAFSENDQRKIEESLGIIGGKPSRHEYDGMYVRKRKKRD